MLIKHDPGDAAAFTDLRHAGFGKAFLKGAVGGEVAGSFTHGHRARPAPAAALNHRLHQVRAGGLAGGVGKRFKQVGLEQDGLAAQAVRKSGAGEQPIHRGGHVFMDFFDADKGHGEAAAANALCGAAVPKLFFIDNWEAI